MPQQSIFPGLAGRIAITTGGAGAIGGAIAEGLVRAGAHVAVWDVDGDGAGRRVKALEKTAEAGRGLAVQCDATDNKSINLAMHKTLSAFGSVDVLVNAAGGSHPSTTTSEELSFFDIVRADIDRVIALNYHTALLPAQSIGRIFAEQGHGVILNIASIAGLTPLTRAVAYSNGKAAVVSFTRWLAVYMAQEYSPAIRVNALAPGFVLTCQNRFLLRDSVTGKPTPRCKQILTHVPMRRLGRPEEMVGPALWLLSDAASFVTGVVIPIDGGYSAFSGV
jgi:NAD(P)-dependent dehydrogenase (short-subunit alcohol dehydrogenase family)